MTSGKSRIGVIALGEQVLDLPVGHAEDEVILRSGGVADFDVGSIERASRW